MMRRYAPPAGRAAARLCLAGLCAALLACDGKAGAKEQRPQPEAVPVSVAPVQLGALDRAVEVVGSLFGDEEATLSAKVPGRIVRVLADVGDRVAPGAPLALIDPADYEIAITQREMALREALAKLGLTELPGAGFDPATVATVERARYEAANAAAKAERARQLYQQQPPLISEQDFQDLQTTFQVAQQNFGVALLEARSQLAQARTRQSDLEAARQRLADATIRAPGNRGSPANAEASESPVAGADVGPTTRPAADRFAISQRLVSEGEYVREGDPAFRLVADDPIKLRASVPERHVADLRPGQTLIVRVEGYADAFPGRVSRVNPAIDQQSRAFQIEAVVPNADRRLRPGAFAKATVLVGRTPEVLFVPDEAVVSFAGIDRVFTVHEGKAVEHTVRRGLASGGLVALDKPLEGVTAVITRGQARLAGGMPVTIEPAPAAAATRPAAKSANAEGRSR